MTMRTETKHTGHRTAAMLILPLVLGLSSCGFSPGVAPAQLLDLGPPNDSVSTSGRPSASPGFRISSSVSGSAPHGEPVAISVSGTQMLTDTGVIWREADSTVAHSYATYRWAAPPLQLVQQRVIERLSATRAVVQDGADPFAPMLQISLARFEQIYAPDGASSVGQVSIRAVLVRDHHVTASIQLSRSAPAPTQDALGGVTALRAATDAATKDLSAWLEQNLPASGAAPPHR